MTILDQIQAIIPPTAYDPLEVPETYDAIVVPSFDKTRIEIAALAGALGVTWEQAFQITIGCLIDQEDVAIHTFGELPVGKRFYAEGRPNSPLYTKTPVCHMNSSAPDGGSPVNAEGDLLHDGRVLPIYFMESARIIEAD